MHMHNTYNMPHVCLHVHKTTTVQNAKDCNQFAESDAHNTNIVLVLYSITRSYIEFVVVYVNYLSAVG